MKQIELDFIHKFKIILEMISNNYNNNTLITQL